MDDLARLGDVLDAVVDRAGATMIHGLRFDVKNGINSAAAALHRVGQERDDQSCRPSATGSSRRAIDRVIKIEELADGDAVPMMRRSQWRRGLTRDASRTGELEIRRAGPTDGRDQIGLGADPQHATPSPRHSLRSIRRPNTPRGSRCCRRRCRAAPCGDARSAADRRRASPTSRRARCAACRCRDRADCADRRCGAIRVGAIPVGDPLPHVARHVVELQVVRRIAADRAACRDAASAPDRAGSSRATHRRRRPTDSARRRDRRARRVPIRLRSAAAPGGRCGRSTSGSRRWHRACVTSVTGCRARSRGGSPPRQTYGVASSRNDDSCAGVTTSGRSRMPGAPWPVSRVNSAYCSTVIGWTEA